MVLLYYPIVHRHIPTNFELFAGFRSFIAPKRSLSSTHVIIFKNCSEFGAQLSAIFQLPWTWRGIRVNLITPLVELNEVDTSSHGERLRLDLRNVVRVLAVVADVNEVV